MTNAAPGHGGVERHPSTLATHEFPGGDSRLLKDCLKLVTQVTPGPEGKVNLNVELTAMNVGHRVPTGFVDHHLILVVNAYRDDGSAARLIQGPRLSEFAGRLVGSAGRLFGKQLRDVNDNGPIPFWGDVATVTDSRLYPEKTDYSQFTFPAGTSRFEVRVVYRKTWQSVADEKKWPDNEREVLMKAVQTRPDASIRSTTCP